ncbi:MAG: DUF86 domain-containing protein [Candidatus Margulisiibacteriota bacterium]
MSERDHILFLQDILESLEKISKYCKDKTFEEFKSSELLVDGVVRNLEIIGEAAKKLPDNIKQKYPDVEWKKISGLRDILIHDYIGIDYDVLWDIIANKVPDLKSNIKRIKEN